MFVWSAAVVARLFTPAAAVPVPAKWKARMHRRQAVSAMSDRWLARFEIDSAKHHEVD